ncbi:hypothetical protein BCR43DRAFT_485066 [Syncephalastrum racemosum]|uniref:Cyclin-like domain-containing protein n=1 Tax=Syncephalastrum racemosum TaxID=13706 RepID=A0A1X2HNA1_SYNRA|nr:hypothetical protein BCR43DRAFT_485066 [Syncephalastrum racemosum]
MGTTKSRKSRRNNSRPTAFKFLSTIPLGSEDDPQSIPAKQPNNNSQTSDDFRPGHSHSLHNECHDPRQVSKHLQSRDSLTEGLNTELAAVSLISTDSNFSDDANVPQADKGGSRLGASLASSAPVMTANKDATSLLSAQIDKQNNTNNNNSNNSNNRKTDGDRRRWSTESNDNGDVQHHKLTREDSERPIASEKIKKKSHHADKDDHGILSMFRYYTDKIRFSAGKRKTDESVNRGYLQQQLASHDSNKRRPALSYAHFLVPSHSLESNPPVEPNQYDPCSLDNESYNRFGYLSSSQGTAPSQTLRPSELKRELNEQFRLVHPEIPPEITLSKIRAIKTHLVEIGREVDLEISSVAHAFVYFEKLVTKNVVTKRNRKLIAACCLFLATKVNEAKGTWFEPLFDAIDDELDVDSKEVRDHEFAVFADLEFNLYIPQNEFMPHFEHIFRLLEYKSFEEYLGTSNFYDVKSS